LALTTLTFHTYGLLDALWRETEALASASAGALLINLGTGQPVLADHTHNGCLIHLFPGTRLAHADLRLVGWRGSCKRRALVSASSQLCVSTGWGGALPKAMGP
jgi:hypothetical protein